MALQHLRSSTASKRPTPAAMSDGQLAINTNTSSPGLFFKDSGGALIKVGPVHVGTTAPNASPAAGGETGNTVGEKWLDTTGGGYVFKVWDGSAWRSETGEFVNVNGDTMTGDLVMNNANIVFEGATADDFETTLTVTDPTADRTITLPDVSGTVVTTGDTGSVTSTMLADGTIVDADISGTAEIAVSKLQNGTARQLLQTDAAGTGVEWASNIDIPGTLDVTSTATFDSNVTINGQGDLRFADSDSSNWVAFQAPATVASDVTWTLPSADGTSGQVLSTNGSGTLSWATAAGGGGDKIEEGNSSAEVIDTGSDGRFVVTTEGSERLRVTSAGLVGIGTSVPSNQFSVGGGVGATPTISLDYTVNNTSVASIGASHNSGEVRYNAATNYFPTFYASGSERARIDSSGRLLVGTSTAEGIYRISSIGYTPAVQVKGGGFPGGSLALTGTDGGAFWLTNSTTQSVADSGLGVISFNAYDGTNYLAGARIQAFTDGTCGANDLPTRLVFSTTADGASSPTERVRITQQGSVLINNTTRATQGTLCPDGIVGTQPAISCYQNATTSQEQITFRNPNGGVGSITTNASATAYNTSSDYRLKENVTAVTDGITRLQQLKPSRFNFIADPDTTVDGFLAHEVQTIVPEAITGEKDAVDDDGNPEYQGIDQSKLVPLLTAALQEAVAKIESLEARLTAAGI